MSDPEVSMSSLRKLLAPVVAALAVLAVPAAAMAHDGGALYTQTNDPAGNVVLRFDRAADGSLTPAGTFSTGGAGLASLGGRQGAVELSDSERRVYAVNAGSDTITVFRVKHGELVRRAVVPSGGVAPTSVDEQHGRVYVLNSGGVPNVTAFAAGRHGSLRPLASRDLPGALGAAQVSVSPDGRDLVVTERLSNRLETLSVDRWGRLGEPVITASSGTVPFGFAFARDDRIVVSEAGASTVSSYRVGHGLTTITASLTVGQGAACWVAVSPDGRWAYTGNASGSISGFSVGRDGALTALTANGLSAAVPSPRDLDFSRDGRFLYVVSPGNATAAPRVNGYRVGRDGALTQITTAPALPGLTGAAGA
jgi:6-phosphogluconolactonase (cycloisomerase 2 family)